MLDAASIKYKIYSEKFKRNEDDTRILRLAGEKGYGLLTCDSKNRYRDVERAAVLYYKVRQFVFSGNLGGIPLARLLVKIKNEIRQFCRDHERPFVATITVGGKINLLMDKNGNIHGRKKEE
ncbi:MAG TPA: hypothetical protein VFQ41_15285 [Candidatus Angelobacter sp.]|nr:hypothetical protein [Candidatus Angelobacter sp.]